MRDDFDRHRWFYLIGTIAVVVFVAFLLGAFDKSKDRAGSATTNASSSTTSQPAASAPGKNTSDGKPSGFTNPFDKKPVDNSDGTTAKSPALKPAADPGSPNCPGDHSMAVGESYTAKAGCITKGDVEVQVSSTWVSAHKSDNWGNILVCNSDCPLQARYGANVSNRTFTDLYSEMQKTGCANNAGCGSNIHCWVYNGALAEVNCSSLITSAAAPITPPCNAKACPGDANPPQQTVNNCGGELKRGETRTIPAGCTIVGDVIANGKLQKAGMNGRNDVGFVQKLTVDTAITAPYQAGVYDASISVDSLVNITKIAGCDQGDGCTGGVYDWAGNRLDK